MRRMAAIWAALAAGCGGNPYDTSADRARYEEMTEQGLERQILAAPDLPQTAPVPFADPDLEAWRDTVLATASDETLRRLQQESRRKCAWLEARCGDLLRQDEINREPQCTTRLWQLRTERTRLKMIEDRLSTGAPRRTE